MNVAVTGSGIVSAIGLDKRQVLESLMNGRTGIGPMQYLQSAHRELPVGEVKLTDDQMKQRLGIDTDKVVSRTALMGMLAISQAVQEAGIGKRQGKRIVLISGTTVGGMDVTERCFLDGTLLDNPDSIVNHDCGNNTRLMASHFGIFDDVTTISTACSSAANAIMLGVRLIKAGEADVVVAGGTEALSLFHLNGFNSLMILDHEQCRPFDATRAGLNLGEGAAYVVLESRQQAIERNVAVQAYVTGYGNACDAFHQTASSENGEGAYRAMTEALEMAHLQPADVHYVNAHGTGTPNNDQSESAALRRVFAQNMPPVSSTKSFTGHTTSASGSIEIVICLLAMQHGFIPASLGCSTADPACITPTAGLTGVKIEHVLCNSFGFGGNDSALVLSAHPTCPDTGEEPLLPADAVKEVARVEITSADDLAEIKHYVKPLEARRMGKLMKSSLLASLKAMEQAGIDMPDAIITGTAYGCIENSERLLEQLAAEGETALKPTYFMQSTHNTIGSNIAIRTHCHGYNITYTQEAHSLEWALRDASLLLRSGRCKTVLVGCHDESAPSFTRLMHSVGLPCPDDVKSTAIVLTVSCGE